MSSKQFIYDASGNVTKEVVVHDAENFTLVTRYDADPLLDFVKAQRETRVRDRKSHWRPAAEIPPWVIDKAMREGWADDPIQWARWFNEGENRCWHLDDDLKQISGREGGR